jgi:hypothetical protein
MKQLQLSRWFVLIAVGLLPWTGCDCTDSVETTEPWVFEESEDLGPTDLGDLDAEDTRDIIDVADAPPNISDTPEPLDLDGWEPENVIDEVECSDARNDRTSMAIDSEGTVWFGYHRYEGTAEEPCSRSILVLAHRRVGGEWKFQELERHRGLFAIEVVEPGQPVVVYPDPFDRQFEGWMRRPNGSFDRHIFDISPYRITGSDGFDLTQDGRRFFVTFAPNRGSEVLLFSYDTASNNPSWQSRRNLQAENPSAAYERGLRAHPDDGVYLVHRNDDIEAGGRYGIARYDKAMNRWTETAYFDDGNQFAEVHSFAVMKDGDLCMASQWSGSLMVTCGDMQNLQSEQRRFPEELLPGWRYPASLVVGDDSTLYAVYNPADNAMVKVAKRVAADDWEILEVYRGSSYAVSTSIDQTGDLVIGFYTCGGRDGTCSLKVIRESPESL